MIAPSFSSRLLTPTLGEERTETAKALGIDHPALGAASGKEGRVYHNLSPKAKPISAEENRPTRRGGGAER